MASITCSPVVDTTVDNSICARDVTHTLEYIMFPLSVDQFQYITQLHLF